MKLRIDKAANPNELLSKLQLVDIAVPGRAKGRKSHHTERWTICRLLATLADTTRLRFPVSVVHQDRPDALIQADSMMIGVEISEAITPQYAEYCALAEREFPGKWLEPAHFRWGAPSLTVKEMRALLQQDRLTSDGWAGNTPEQEWAHFILSLVETKLEKLSKDGFERFDQNWLAIYDNLPLPNIYLERAIDLLRPMLERQWQKMPGFDALFVEHGPVIAEITATGSIHLILNDLWN